LSDKQTGSERGGFSTGYSDFDLEL